ncbi:hypothetical protein ACS0TY_021012 [Phlomoides rotata]
METGTSMYTNLTFHPQSPARQLREVNNKAYDSQMVAIGPYHHGKDELKKMEELKLRFMRSLLNRKSDVPVERYLSEI